MIASKKEDGSIECIGFCESSSSDFVAGYIKPCANDGFFRFYPEGKNPLTCSDLKVLSKEVAKTNAEARKAREIKRGE